MNEFDLISHYFDWPEQPVDLAVGDDAALISVPRGHQLVVSADMLVAGRHFFADVDPYRLGMKSLAVNLSDLAAMGATPRWFTLSLALPAIDPDWLQAFSAGLRAQAQAHAVALVGGDTTCGPLTIAIQIGGEVPRGQALLRSGGRPGDDIWVSGPLGAAAAAVMHKTGRVDLPTILASRCQQALDQPTPRLALGQALRGIASAALDISDGLVGDLAHIGQRSGCGAEIEWSLVPVWPELVQALPLDLRQEAILSGGDDYELCFTVPARHRALILDLGSQLGLALTRVGQLVVEQGVSVLGNDRKPLSLGKSGFDHFGTP